MAPIPFPAAVLAGGRSRRMGRPKASLPYGPGTLLEHQTARLAPLFAETFVVLKEPPEFPVGPARVLLDRDPGFAAVFGLTRALEEARGPVFVLAVDLPLMPADLIREIARRGLESSSPALVPRAGGLLQPLAAVWKSDALTVARSRIARGDLALQGLAEEAGAEILEEEALRRFDPSAVAFTNLNTIESWVAMRERA
ncbi:MAG: molybdenum cofactor guanylyltransferase [Thermoanaerobaculia bacterium]